MRRRSRASSKQGKTRRRKAEMPKRRDAGGVRHRSSATAPELELARLTRERDEALERETATSQVLKVISASPGALEPVFDAMLENATRICGAKFGNLWLAKNGGFQLAATHGLPPEFQDQVRRKLVLYPGPTLPIARAASTREPVHILDLRMDPSYVEREPIATVGVERGQVRTMVAIPMLKDRDVVGVFAILRQEVLPFVDKQIELLQNFAAQAVIAIENARLLNELRQRTADLSESLEQQTATSEVLRVISSSQGELQSIFQAILENATRICEAYFATLLLREGSSFRAVALHNAPLAYVQERKRDPLILPTATGSLTRLIATKQFIHITDLRTEQSYLDRSSPSTVVLVEAAGARSYLAVPMLNDDDLIGAIVIYRQEVRPFTDKQIALLQNFAAQAVIAIENTRLLNELRQRTDELSQRTDDLSEALEQQTATADVLRIISSSPGELEPVFQAMLENATRICEAKFGTLFRFDGKNFHPVAQFNTPVALLEAQTRRGPFQPPAGSQLDRVMRTKRASHTADDAAEPVHGLAATLGSARSLIAVPMLKADSLIGAIVIYRQEVRPFTEKQIALVQNFANQAVIAIENTRLLNELRQSLEQQTATADVLRIISSSPGELKPVFNAMLENAVRLCEAEFGHLFLYDGEAFQATALHSASQPFTEVRRQPVVLRGRHPATPLARMARTKAVVHIADVRTEKSYIERVDPVFSEFVDVSGARTDLLVPMLKENELVGAFVIYRLEVRPFTDKQIELLKNFAAQAVIAIENARLLNELRQRTTDLTESLEQQTATSEVLQVISSSPGGLEPVFQVMLQNAARICEAKFSSLYLYDGERFRVGALHNAPAAFAEFRRREPVFRPPPGTGLAQIVATKRTSHDVDITLDKGYVDRNPIVVAAVELGGFRTVLTVPLLKDDNLIGCISIYRQEVWPFTDKQTALVQNFAAQAVIAIENARLLNELRESLEQQTATSEVLKVISSSPANIQPVLVIIGERAQKLCDAETSVVSIVEAELIRLASVTGMTEAGVEAVQRAFPMQLTDETVTARAVRTRSVCHVADVLNDPQYQQKDTARVSGYRGCLGVPMVRDEQVVGAIFVARRQPGLFSDAQVQLLKTFADQAVIAIENVRLFNETKYSLEQQTATADVLKTISRSAFNLQTVLQTLVESAARFCSADKATIIREKDGSFYTAEAFGYSREFLEYMRAIPIKAERGSASGRSLLEGRVIHIPDVKADAEYTFVEAPRLGDFRTALCVPMLREGDPIGVLTLTRSEVQPFMDKQIELVTTFADQAAIAIENVRLFDEIRTRADSLKKRASTNRNSSPI
jgi:GAF domain-containing protein